MIFNILLGFKLPVDLHVFEKVFKLNNFIISKEKYLFMGGRTMPECSMQYGQLVV